MDSFEGVNKVNEGVCWRGEIRRVKGLVGGVNKGNEGVSWRE